MLPASAGMFPGATTAYAALQNAPRKCGDVPLSGFSGGFCQSCSPQARGCSLVPAFVLNLHPMLPASAGMFPLTDLPTIRWPNAPRKRGDVPNSGADLFVAVQCSPQARGCSRFGHQP